MPRSTSELRELWKEYECKKQAMVLAEFGPDRVLVARPTVDAWRALATVFVAHGYQIRTTDTDSYNCRTITGGTGKSLHSYGIALDINWTTNPYIDHEGSRAVRFSTKATQAERALDVKHRLADTDMTPEMIDDALAIKTVEGLRVFEWGGSWQTVKDSMHFEIDVSPAELTRVDWATVKGGGAAQPLSSSPTNPAAAFRVIARSGLNLRSGPGTDFPVIGSLAFGRVVQVISQSGPWALVDINGAGGADGHVHTSFLEPV